MSSILEAVVHELLVRDMLLRVPISKQVPEFLPEQLPSIREWLRDDDVDRAENRDVWEFECIQEAVRTASLPTVTYAATTAVQYQQSFQYRTDSTARDGGFYVHVPPWVKVHRAPFHTFGPNLFGLAYTSTGDVHIRDDLEGDEFAEVLQHEVFHQLYPNCSEGQIRQFTLARFGERACIHHRIGPAP